MFHFALFKNESVVKAHAWVSTVAKMDASVAVGVPNDGPTHENTSNIAGVIVVGYEENAL